MRFLLQASTPTSVEDIIPTVVVISLCLAGLSAPACGGGAGPDDTAAPHLEPVYDRTTGQLEQLISDRDGDGRMDAWAYMDGRRLERVEIDRDGDGHPDRIEHYGVGDDPSAPLGGAVILTAEESKGPATPINRREFYEGGALVRVEEDVDGNGLIERWEQHERGALVWVAFDSRERGSPDRRLYYGPRGQALRVEVDPDGDGVFEPAGQTSSLVR